MLQNLLNYLQNLQTETLILPLTYLALAGSYLLVIPVLVLTYMKFRWYSVSSFERGFMYFLVFLFFPGLLLLSPFVNFRPRRRQIEV
ncbi:NAD(P)H-quinone oxidoreductase subunit L [Calothrix sp. CCY 0018]|uniref:NAD(P)H-quinone oxidoreductase subunit L n=1 Tax=Calothrix sp. CCY 0018 TaxID=3103864 RepID=UPI0039C6591F